MNKKQGTDDAPEHTADYDIGVGQDEFSKGGVTYNKLRKCNDAQWQERLNSSLKLVLPADK